MQKIINFKKIKEVINQLHQEKKSIVLVGGCFDILHIGHIQFLKQAKKLGNTLLVLLESDEKVKILKGKNRPFFSQKERAEMLSSLEFVDLVILLPLMKNDQDYQNLILKIKPKIIAVTDHDPLFEKKKIQAKIVGGKIKIIPYISFFSSSKLAKILGVD